MKGLLLIIPLLISPVIFSYSQKKNSSGKDVYGARQIVFYGYDYTHFKIADRKRLKQDIKKFMKAWISICQRSITPRRLQNWLDKDSVSFNSTPTFLGNEKLKSQDLVTETTNTVSQDSIQSFIDQYSITEKEGIGFIVILECFDNASLTTSAYFTFFDIATKKILMSDYIISYYRNSYNRATDWGGAKVVAFKKYAAVYKDNSKLYVDGGQY